MVTSYKFKYINIYHTIIISSFIKKYNIKIIYR